MYCRYKLTNFLLTLCTVFLIAYAGAGHVHAQMAPLSLVASPAHPAPQSTVSISLDDYALDTVGAAIQWYIDGTAQSDFHNKRTISVTTGGLGMQNEIRAVLTKEGMAPITANLTLKPTVVDIIIEANTYVPLFYEGRALPTNSSQVRATAVVHDGTTQKANAYSYKWKLGEEVLLGGTELSAQTVSFAYPRYRETELFVEAYDARGNFVGEGTTQLLATEPELHFYEYSQLRGLSGREMQFPFRSTASNSTLYAEPYYLNTTMHGADATYTWYLNNTEVPHDQNSMHALSLKRVGEGGSATVHFKALTHATPPQFIEKVFDFIFEKI